jgi:23S rRNA (guanosine2251-2'-O)-methyltransferase
MKIYSAVNMMKFLDKSKENGWNIVGTALSKESISLSKLPVTKPTIVVLGNEGHGIRTNILNRCSHLIKIDSRINELDSDVHNVDSLNVSVTGGIILHHIVSNNK